MVGVDVGAVGEDVGEGRAGETGAEGFGGHVAEGVVVGVEEPVEVRVEVLVVGEEFAQDEGLKEPGGVGEVPLGGAGLRTGLDHDVFRRERGGEGEGGGADGAVTVEQRGSRSGGGDRRRGLGFGIAWSGSSWVFGADAGQVSMRAGGGWLQRLRRCRQGYAADCNRVSILARLDSGSRADRRRAEEEDRGESRLISADRVEDGLRLRRCI